MVCLVLSELLVTSRLRVFMTNLVSVAISSGPSGSPEWCLAFVAPWHWPAPNLNVTTHVVLLLMACVRARSYVCALVPRQGGGKGLLPEKSPTTSSQSNVFRSSGFVTPVTFIRVSPPARHRVNSGPLIQPIANAGRLPRWAGLCPEGRGQCQTAALGLGYGNGLLRKTVTNPLTRCHGPRATPPSCVLHACIQIYLLLGSLLLPMGPPLGSHTSAAYTHPPCGRCRCFWLKRARARMQPLP